jgi:hypothetical protein
VDVLYGLQDADFDPGRLEAIGKRVGHVVVPGDDETGLGELGEDDLERDAAGPEERKTPATTGARRW